MNLPRPRRSTPTVDLGKLTSHELGLLFPIFISEPDPAWPDYYKAEEDRIRSAIGAADVFNIQHIGSTAVPRLKAKPTIDILLEIPPDADQARIIACLTRLSYWYIPKPENPAPHMMFVKGYTPRGFEGQAFHVHVRYPGDWDEPYFRDYLIQHPPVAQEYSRLKIKLAKEYTNDRDAYTEQKTEFIGRVTAMAREKGKQHT